ncbi:MAG TPA: hypothetical protein VJ044_20740 [Candidatus Hodarchaeales archaeon]|nr:hypothetical protein [Candidatus Hodarchaeales archaeon]
MDDPIKRLLGRSEEQKSARMTIKELIDASKDADLKSHLSESETLTFAKADFYAEELGNVGFDDCKKLINFFSDRMMRKRFSFNRMSRVEFGEGFKSELPVQMQEDRNKIERMIK